MPSKKRPGPTAAPSRPATRKKSPAKETQQASTRPAPRKPSAARTRAPRTTAARRESRRSTGSQPLRILMVASEAHPFAKTGGLGEMTAALAAAVVELGHTVTLVLPRYRGVAPDVTAVREIDVPLGSAIVRAGIVEQRLADGVQVALVDVPALFDRAGIYGDAGHDYPDNALRFAVLARAALEYARAGGLRYDVIHAHDWQSGLVPVYQKMLMADDPVVGGVPVVFTIHNLAFQGIFSSGALETIGLGWDVFHPDALEYWGNISFLKGGVNFSERITTVSPTYAKEILTREFGFGFEGVMMRRAADLQGILNGIDTTRWNPAADAFVPASFSAGDLSGKRDAKRALLEEVGLPADEAALDRPLIGLISRLTDQKGFDLIGASANDLMALEATWVMLGSGERHYEDLWRSMATRHPDRVSTTIGFDERLAHVIEAGADIFLMPSRFEPCGLNQLYSLRYGTVPVVRATGGLHDTVTDADEPGGNGIKFAEYTGGALIAALVRALELYKVHGRWTALQRAGMAADPSWDASAREYVKVYRGQR